MTKDSVLVLMHDDKLDRTTTGTGFVSDYTYSELQSFYLEDYQKTKTSYKIPTLDEALQWGKGKVVYTLRSEERRVGKECRSGWPAKHQTTKTAEILVT